MKYQAYGLPCGSTGEAQQMLTRFRIQSSEVHQLTLQLLTQTPTAKLGAAPEKPPGALAMTTVSGIEKPKLSAKPLGKSMCPVQTKRLEQPELNLTSPASSASTLQDPSPQCCS